MASAPRLDWFAEQIRCTAFLSVESTFGAEWWNQVVAEEPESEVIKPRQGRYSAEIEMDAAKLVLEIQPGRADWYLRARRIEDDDDDSFPIRLIGDAVNQLPSFSDLVISWLKLVDSIDRLAFGAVLLHPVETREAGYRLVDELLPSVTLDDPDHSFDFFYQINRPREAQSYDTSLRLNRLSKWSVLKAFTANYRIDTDQRVTATPIFDAYAVRLELDINTARELENQILVDRQQELFDELMRLGVEISRDGDVP